MGNQILQMKYHPAKKEVHFKRFQSEKEISIRSDSILSKYMKKKGAFVLQDYGNSFFEDIACVFDGERKVIMEVITTKLDYEDLKQMIEYYNENSRCKIIPELIDELPDMNSTYSKVKIHGEKSIEILKKHLSKLHATSLNKNVENYINNFKGEIYKEIKNIEDKINSLSENYISLCFTGVYSTGKSALINSILGYSILPVNVNSETSRMFCLQSPKKNGQVKINFSMQDEETEIIWNKENQVFEFVYGPTEISARKKIQETINKNKENLQYIQLKEILRNINSEDNISAEIKIDFPIPIDNKKVKFRIYDTPGTDSNYGQHKIVIKDALAKQTHSILIFVAAPNKLEGEGNNSLLNYLKEAEKKDSKTSIDIDRSLFVINFADTISPTDRKELQTKEIKNKSHNDFSIKLSDKKLFFTSAKIAYAAKAKKNGIATEDEEYIINHHQDIDNPKYGRYYQQNRIATSELATKYSNERNKEALELAIKRKNNLEVFNICSGLYALESEIIKFGEKYSSAVKTFAIIDSVDKTLSKLKMDLKPLESKNQKTITEIDKDINLLKTTISEGINKIYIEREIDLEDNIQEKTLKELGLLADQNDYRISEIIEEVDKLLKGWFLGFGKVKYNEKSKDKIGNLIISKFDDYNREFFNKKNLILEEIRDGFIKDIQEEIRNNGKLSQEAREYVAEIRTPDLENNIDSEYFKEIYNNSKITGRILFLIKTDLVDKDRFSKQIEEEISNIMEIISNEYEKNFKYSQNEILKKIKSEFSNNIHRYNVLIKAKIQDKEIMEDLKTKINDIAISLKKCQDNLNSSIWRGDNNEK